MTANPTQSHLREAYHKIQSGDHDAAQAMLTEILRDDPTNADALYIASFLADSLEDRVKLLRRVLGLNPDHNYARQALEAAERDPFSTTLIVPDDDSFLKPPKTKRAFDERHIIGIAALVLLAFLLGYVVGKGWLFAPPAPPAIVTSTPYVITVIAESDELTSIPSRQPPRSLIVTATNSPNASSGSVERIDVSIDDDPHIGSLDSPVVMVEFGDYEDPFTAKFHNETLPRLLERYQGQLLYVFRDFPLESHVNAFVAAGAANCANEQGSFWGFHNAILTNDDGGRVGYIAIMSYVEQLGLDVDAFDNCWLKRLYEAEVQQDIEDGQAYGVEAAPTFFINGYRVIGALSVSDFMLIIEGELED